MEIDLTVRVSRSFEEMEALDLEDIARLTPAEKLRAAVRLACGYPDDNAPPRLARILRIPPPRLDAPSKRPPTKRRPKPPEK